MALKIDSVDCSPYGLKGMFLNQYLRHMTGH
jgi:hypothetical protein